MKIDKEIQKFTNEVKIWSKKLKVFPLEIRLARIKAWGYCSANGTLYFNSDLLFKRKELQVYVIVHELLHLKIKNHGRLFQALMSLHVPDWRELDMELNKPSLEQNLSFEKGATF